MKSYELKQRKSVNMGKRTRISKDTNFERDLQKNNEDIMRKVAEFYKCLPLLSFLILRRPFQKSQWTGTH